MRRWLRHFSLDTIREDAAFVMRLVRGLVAYVRDGLAFIETPLGWRVLSV